MVGCLRYGQLTMRIHACMYACMIHTCIHACMHTCVHVCVCACLCGLIYAGSNTHISIRMDTSRLEENVARKRISHVTHVKSRVIPRTVEWVVLFIWTSTATHVKASCHACD